MTEIQKVMVLAFPGERTTRALGAVLWLRSLVWDVPSTCGDSGFVFEPFCEVVCEEVCERELKVCTDDSVFTHPDLLEHGLVHRSSDLLGGMQVGGLARRDDVEGGVEVSFDLFESVCAGVEDSVGSRFFRGDAGLFFFEEFYVDSVCVVGVEKLLSFAFECREASRLPVCLVLVEIPGDFYVVGDVSSDAVELVCS